MSTFSGPRRGCARRGVEGTGGRTFFAFGLACGTPTVDRGRFGFADGVLLRSTRTRVSGRSSRRTGRAT
ncbi:hypothetical protein AB4039_16810 [Streptomyces sp. M-16]|uniref:hypothetical protein n=1 Tax=Streptomyces sp. M-16 TaxID=3233040 RepID=UPI003F9D7CB8